MNWDLIWLNGTVLSQLILLIGLKWRLRDFIWSNQNTVVTILSEIVFDGVKIEFVIDFINQVFVIEILRVGVDDWLLRQNLLLIARLRLNVLILILLLLLVQYLSELVKENVIPSKLHVASVLIRNKYIFEHIN